MGVKDNDGKWLVWWEKSLNNLSSLVASDPCPRIPARVVQPSLEIYQVSFQGLFLGYVGLSNYTP